MTLAGKGGLRYGRAMMHRNRNVALIVAAGRGERAGGAVPKQFRRVAGKTLIAHAVDAFAAHETIHDIILVIGKTQEQEVQAALGSRALPDCVTGGATRQQSVYAGLEHIEKHGGAGRIFIHDAARPFLPAQVIDRLMNGLDEAPGAIPVLPVVDTLARDVGVLGDIVERSGLIRVQTPQAFDFHAILMAHRSWRGDADASDDAQIARAAGLAVALVEGDSMLEKLTHPADFALAEERLAGQFSIRTGMGYDVHRLVAEEELWLCGVRVAHDRGLSGHSDADVALHALTDALFGAMADGDIGSHFPPSEAQWRGAASSRFLAYARDRVAVRGGRIEHVDLTIICEAPKIGPHRDAMRSRIADILEIDLGRVSVKATTTERLGFAGRGEGIAAQAIATLSLPGVF
ncbi:2-C-methyl-D-erythritol 4-phosphate cytidylyltransferase/2-C-methyl-D-erythritol 2,4-cyclodiphosphate synthase [Rhizorhapis suberifaciens]|uniref:Bifunctional enzyme IspD/IspF n=2 Tax=Rhizorhapis suberifaciens TaxID=13656 RepID=A0A840HVH4_9SPHN|nr:2-C-methyl-D-erythritol 4-phosphate cytidylyltransferase/2-C-methyl-D-erythritol 2,4-cyclodiphosphate synthase [Rhizorhapis suberifaciens]